MLNKMSKGEWKNKGKKSRQRRLEELHKQRYSCKKFPTQKQRQIQTNKKEEEKNGRE